MAREVHATQQVLLCKPALQSNAAASDKLMCQHTCRLYLGFRNTQTLYLGLRLQGFFASWRNSSPGLAADLDGTASRVASSKNGVHQQHVPLCNVSRKLLIDQLLLNHSVANFANSPALARGVPVLSIGCVVLGSWVMPALCSFTVAK